MVALSNKRAEAHPLSGVDLEFIESERKWQRRTTQVKVLGRLYPADPASREAWAMRVLLLHSRGCKCSEDIRTIYGEVRATFVEAAKVVGLIHDDHEFVSEVLAHMVDDLLPPRRVRKTLVWKRFLRPEYWPQLFAWSCSSMFFLRRRSPRRSPMLKQVISLQSLCPPSSSQKLKMSVP